MTEWANKWKSYYDSARIFKAEQHKKYAWAEKAKGGSNDTQSTIIKCRQTRTDCESTKDKRQYI